MRVLNARETTLEELEPAQALLFIEEHHKQGVATPGKNPRAYGLYSKDELVAVAFFCNPRTMGMQRKYTSELFRLAFKSDVRIRGGASKLIKAFMKSGAWDLFTYQDTAGESTDVYELAGMTLVGPKNPKPKKILVKDGLTAATVSNNRHDWFSMEQVVNYGPDRLLGTSLGTQFREDGTRKSNVDLFLELGYHLEEVPGDRIYEWHNPDVWFYTYKITSTKDKGYYFGRHMMRGPMSHDRALNDGYMGSGGKKLRSWIQKVGEDSLRKEILELHKTWKSVVAAEKRLIGDLNLTDPECKNFQPGGTGVIRRTTPILDRECPVHGVSKHQGDSCMKCASQASFDLGSCPIHGSTTFHGSSCIRCSAERSISLKVCTIHGETKHNGSSCIKCSVSQAWTQDDCEVHGLTPHRSGVCEKCAQADLYTEQSCLTHGVTLFRGPTCVKCSQPQAELKECATHGAVLHWGSVCLTCNSRKSVTVKTCPIHGEVKHQGEVCSRCNAENSVVMLECAVHGLTKHQGSHCMKCNAQGQLKLAVCDVHGEVTHKGGTCTVCTSQKAVSLKICAVHGETKHQGDVCNKCNALKSVNMRECPTHGLTKHQGKVCAKCNTQARVTMGECAKHGTTKFQGKGCVKCRNEALITVKECPVHGPWKHRGKTCYACVSDRRKLASKMKR